jgi:heptosyltransferase-2
MPKRILVVRLSSLGDVVLTGPIYRNLKAHWPDCHIAVLVKPAFAPLLANNPHIDEILVYRGLRSALREIRRRGFSHLLDLHATWRTFWIRTLAAVTNTVVYRKHALARRLYVLFRWSSPALAKHVLERYLECLAAWDIPIRHRELTLGDYGSTQPAKSRPAQRVLLAQTSFLGDTLLTMPLAKRLKEILPHSRLTVLTRPDTADVFRRSEFVDEVIIDDKRGSNGGLRGILSLARKLRSQAFDLTLVAHRSFRSALVMWLAGIPRRIGFSSSAGWFFYHETVFHPWGMPELERNLALLLPLKPDLRAASTDSLYLAGRNDNSESLSERLTAAGVKSSQPIIGLHPGSVWPTKRWLPERFAALADRLQAQCGAKVLLIGGPGDRVLCGSVAAQCSTEVLDWSGKTTLEELMDLASRLALLVTNDSGPMHIAAANGVPTLALFGPTTRELGFFPYGKGHRVIEKDLECRPCGLHGQKVCPEGHFLCMRLITVDEVFTAAQEMIRPRVSA